MEEEVKQDMIEDEDYTADIEDEVEEADTEDLEDLSYDEDGNLIFDEEEPEEDVEEEEGDTTPKEGPEEETEEAPQALAAEAPATASVSEDEELLGLAREALAKLGYDDKDVKAGLENLAAEADGKSVEEFRAERSARTARIEEAKRGLAAKKAEDIAAVKAAYPVAAKFNSIDDFPNPQLFMDLRDLGHSPADAFRAACPDIVSAAAAKGSKAHLQSNVPKGAKDTNPGLSKRQLSEFREIFPGKSDAF